MMLIDMKASNNMFILYNLQNVLGSFGVNKCIKENDNEGHNSQEWQTGFDLYALFALMECGN